MSRFSINKCLYRCAFHIFALLIFTYLLLPVVISVLVSFSPTRFIELPETFSLRWYVEFFSSPQWVDGLKNSIYIGILTTVLSLFVSMSTAVAFVRYKFKWKAALSTMIMVPVFFPAVVIGMGLLAYFQRLHLWGSYLSVALAHSLWCIPLVFMVLRVTLEGVDIALEEAARGLGASGLVVFKEIVFPLILQGVVVGVLFSLIISINEFVMALFLSTTNTQTLPVVIWPNLRYLMTPLVAAASGVLTLVTLVGLAVSAKLVNLGKVLRVSD